MKFLQKKQQKIIALALLGIGILLLVFIISSIGPVQILNSLKTSRTSLILAALFIFIINLHLRSLKWFFWLYWKKIPISWKAVIPCYFSNIFLNNFTPIRSGEALAPFLLKTYCGVPQRYGFSLIILDRLIEAFVFLFIMFAISYQLYFGNLIVQNVIIRKIAFFFCLFLTLSLLVLFVFLLKINRIAALLKGIALGRTDSKSKILTTLSNWISSLAEAMREITSKKSVITCLSLTIIAWALDFLYLYILVNSLIPISFFHSLFCHSLAIATAFFSFIPGGIGIGAASYLTIAVLLGYSKVPIGAAVILNSFLVHSLRLILGLSSFLFLIYRKREVLLQVLKGSPD